MEIDATSAFHVGQLWSYETRPQEPKSTFIVVAIDQDPKLGPLISISLQGLKMRNERSPSGYSDTIAHLPFSAASIASSVRALIAANVPLPDYEAGYAQWRQAFDAGNAGAFTLTVAESIDAIEESMDQSS